MIISVLDSITLGDDISLSAISELGELRIYENTDSDNLRERIEDCNVIVVNKIELNRQNLQASKDLKLICVTATGYDNIDVDYCREAGIAVCNVKGYSTNSVVQITLAMVLSLCSNLPSFSDFVRSGEYSKSKAANRLTPVYHELDGKVWGIVGAGNIGKKVALAAEALGCRIVAYKQTQTDELECVDLDELCRISDIISVHLPLTEKTKGIIDERRISMMKENSFFINVARGAVTDEMALAVAIKNGKLGGLGVDVYSVEPFGEEHPFCEIKDLENVCLTPHMAWGAYEARVRCIDEVAENIRSFLVGEVRNRVDL